MKLKTNGVSKYFLQDHLGSTTALTNSSGSVVESATYDSFGNATGNLSTRYGYTGREFDADLGLQYSRARWYDATLGRFISEDPIGFGGGDVNLYGYVHSNSVNKTDPLGLLDPIIRQDPNQYTQDLKKLSCEIKDQNPWIGLEAGGNAQFISSGYGVSGGFEVNVLTGQICFFVKSTPRVGLGLFAGVGAKVNVDLQNRTPRDGWSDYQKEIAVDAAIDFGAQVDLRGGKFVNKYLKKVDRGEDFSSGGIGIGVYGAGIGAGVGIDLVSKRVLYCINSPEECKCS